ncbi:TolB family protein [Nocardia bhagyanarayanae]|uniref:TolB protein n=1 Tax=Nocardia bhagyanarayanae TaxID=1215925 RepID=A0A543FE89_9NOCA|nr:PD40 domain-containing protein [Nocardia bhagyanarayanae]TQM32188.1 TolB protein [Nocardia bhagyanarayanae]
MLSSVALRNLTAAVMLAGVLVGCGSSGPEAPKPRVPKIAFNDGWQSVFVMNLDGSEVVRIGAGSDPAFAPDGSKIVVGGRAIATMDPDGGNVVELAVDGYGPTFSPDGTRIAFARRGAIHVMNSDGSEPKQLTATPDPTGPGQASSQSPAFSPDGSTIAFTRNGGIWLMEADGSNPRPLLADPHWNSDPTFTPDGTGIVFSSNRGGKDRSEIYHMNVDGTGVRPLTDDWTVHPTFSPDGTKILFTRNPAPEPGAEIWVMNSDGTAAQRISDPRQTAQHPGWGAVAAN